MVTARCCKGVERVVVLCFSTDCLVIVSDCCLIGFINDLFSC